MAWYRVVVVNEDARPVQGITVEAIDLTDRTVSSTVVTNRAGEVLFTGLTGPHVFRPRLRRTAGQVGGKTFTGRIEVQVVGLDALCFDFVVDPDGGGTDTTLAAAVASAITAGGTQTIYLCADVTEGPIDIGGLGSSARIIIYAPDRTAVTITGSANEDIFEQTTTGGNIAGALEFHNIGFSIPGTDRAILSIETASELRELVFEKCRFDNQFLMRQAGSVSMGAVHLQVTDCIGDLAGFYQVVGTSATFAPDQLTALNNHLTLDNWWAGGTGNAAPDETRVQGGRYTLGSSSGITFANGDEEQHFQDLIIEYAGTGALFTSGAASNQLEDFSFQNIVIRFTHADGTFCNLGSSNSNVNDGLFIKNIFGFPGTGITPTGTFVTVDTDWTNVHVGNLLAKGFGTTYTGPAAGDDHGLLTGLGDDDHTQYSLLAGRSTGQTLIGGTASGEDLTLQSTANATRGSIFLGTSSQFELAETTGQLLLPTTGSGAGLLIGGDTQLFRIAANELAFDPDTDAQMHIARAKIGFMGANDFAGFSHYDMDVIGSYALLQSNAGATFLNAASGQTLFFRVNNATRADLTSTRLSVLGQLTLPTTGSAGGVLIGAYVQWFRSAANIMALGSGDDLLIQGADELQLRDSALRIFSSVDGTLDIASDIILQLTTPDVFLDHPSGGNSALTITADYGFGESHLRLAPLTGTNRFVITTGTGFSSIGVGASGATEAMRITHASGQVDIQGDLTVQDTSFIFSIPSLSPRITYDTNDYQDFVRSSNNWRVVIGGTIRFLVNSNGQAQVRGQGSTGGVVIGTDTQWYRSAADVMRTPDNLQVDGVIVVPDIAEPSAPAAGLLNYWAFDLNGHHPPFWNDEDGDLYSAPREAVVLTPQPVDGTGATITGGTLVTTSASVYLIHVPTPITVNVLSYNVGTGGSNADNVVRVALYSEDGQTRIINVTDAVGTASGVRTISVTATVLAPGNYYIFICMSSGTVAGPAPTYLNTQGLFETGGASEPDLGGALTVTGGAAPATFDPTAVTTPTDSVCLATRLDGTV